MPRATITSKGQLTLPKQVREHLGVDAGDRIDFHIQDDGTVRVDAATIHADELFGHLRLTGRGPVSLDEMNNAIAEHSRRKA